MIQSILKDLEKTWGYTTEELDDIREKLEELSNHFYVDGYNDRSNELLLDGVGDITNPQYGEKEDQC
jgi:hypothetical protein|tara:strand:- start:15294 stop:15494 length:201 start_codon:yes stop_codon:yes gene_type:complete